MTEKDPPKDNQTSAANSDAKAVQTKVAGLLAKAPLMEDKQGLTIYLQVLALAPNNVTAHMKAGILLGRAAEYKRAAEHFRKVAKLQPENLEARISLGKIAFADADFLKEGIIALQQASTIAPDNAVPFYMLAKLFELSSRLEEAEKYLLQGLRLAPDHPHSHRLYANILRRQGRIDEALARLEAAPIPTDDPGLAITMHFELGKLYDLKKDSEQSYEHYRQGNYIQTQTPQGRLVNKNAYLNMVRHIQQTFTAEWLDTWTPPAPTPGPSNVDPIFLVGFPRSGTTLLDQMLSSHPALQVIEEQPMLVNIQATLAAYDHYPEVLANLDNTLIQALRQQYHADAAQHLTAGLGDVIIDKLPLNIVHVGLIMRLFPNARIILALRHPCDAVLSCFMQSFGYNEAMANFHSLEDAAKLYAEVMSLWRHYTELLPLNYCQIKYEDIVNDLEGTALKLLEFLDVDWDPCVLEFNKFARSRERINTPSYEQVSEKIYTRSRNRWQRYEKQFQRVIPDLAPYIEYFDY